MPWKCNSCKKEFIKEKKTAHCFDDDGCVFCPDCGNFVYDPMTADEEDDDDKHQDN
jgi:uncharacterized Zn finger protein (UPF0148 family)